MTDGLINFRSVGDMAVDGGRMRGDRLYRSGHFGGLTPAARSLVLGKAFATVVDLRYAGERATDLSDWPPEMADRILSHDGDRTRESPHLELLRTGSLTVDSVGDFYHTLYAELPFDPLYRSLFAAAVARIAATPGVTLIHCSAGKDRTGILCALILRMVGADMADIEADYLASRHASGFAEMKRAIAARVEARYGYAVADDALDALLGVERAYLQAMFGAIAARCGGVEPYFAQSGINADHIAALRAWLIAKPDPE